MKPVYSFIVVFSVFCIVGITLVGLGEGWSDPHIRALKVCMLLGMAFGVIAAFVTEINVTYENDEDHGIVVTVGERVYDLMGSDGRCLGLQFYPSRGWALVENPRSPAWNLLAIEGDNQLFVIRIDGKDVFKQGVRNG